MTYSHASVSETVKNLVAHLLTEYCSGLATSHSIPDSSVKEISN